MLPLVVFAHVYTNHMVVTTFEEMFDRQRPLPLAELYPPGPQPPESLGSSPGLESSGGVLGLLKHALWHVLWVEAAPQGGWAPGTAALRARLKAHAGALLGRLYDRNCRRAFAPVAAFYAAGLAPERFCAEAASAAAGRGGLMEATHTRVWALLRCGRSPADQCLTSACLARCSSGPADWHCTRAPGGAIVRCACVQLCACLCVVLQPASAAQLKGFVEA